MTPELKHALGLWLIFGGFIPAVVFSTISEWSIRKRRKVSNESRAFFILRTVEVISTVLALLAVGVVGVVSIMRIGSY